MARRGFAWPMGLWLWRSLPAVLAALAAGIVAPPARVSGPEPAHSLRAAHDLRAATVDVAGDSLTVQAFFNGGFGEGAPAELAVMADNGWEARDAQSRVSAEVAAAEPDALVVALATNDADPADGGWTTLDLVRFRRLLNTPPPDTCVIVVTPGYGPTLDAGFQHEIDRARAALRRLVAERPHTVAVDWHAIVRHHPDYIRSDGIHLSGEAAWHARSALYWNGVARCLALP